MLVVVAMAVATMTNGDAERCPWLRTDSAAVVVVVVVVWIAVGVC